MVLAAGLGTRLRPLTNDRPKALVEVAGRTMLEITLTRLRDFEIHDVIINVHHFADLVVEYLKKNNNFGLHIEISREDVLLDTGGGLKKAAWFLDEPFVLHNVDVVSTIDLARMARLHEEKGALATMAVQDRRTSRYLRFDDELRFQGRASGAGPGALAFAGIHVISPRLLEMITEEGVFSIITTYVRLASMGEKILGFRADEYYWRDLGTPENVKRVSEEFPM
jgi:NDP-sugar pyrophosphorylase family protein